MHCETYSARKTVADKKCHRRTIILKNWEHFITSRSLAVTQYNNVCLVRTRQTPYYIFATKP